MIFTADTWIALVAVVISVAWPVFQWFQKSTAKDEAQDVVAELRAEVTSSFGKLEAKVIDHDRTLIRHDALLASLPTKDDTHSIAINVTELVGELRTMNEKIDGLQRGLQRTEKSVGVINETLMQRASS
jgi:hypothetical protein